MPPPKRPAARCAVGLALLAGCALKTAPSRPPAPALLLPAIEYTIQAGAFGDADNAVRLARSLDRAGIDAFHFVGADGLHRVRLGSFASRDAAVRHAEALKADAVIAEYHVVANFGRATGRFGLRGDVVRAALSFLGQPYRWGGADSAFDCSGLTMTAYHLNGLGLPRSSAEQFALGRPVGPQSLREADLVFFAIEARSRPTHVGLYLGEGRFVHAPGEGKAVRVDLLSDAYYARRFLDGRTYLE
jgi:hypothetical protein